MCACARARVCVCARACVCVRARAWYTSVFMRHGKDGCRETKRLQLLAVLACDFQINCRCPGHDFPMTTRRGYLTRTTSYSRLRFNFTQSVVYVQYRCSSRKHHTLPLLAIHSRHKPAALARCCCSHRKPTALARCCCSHHKPTALVHYRCFHHKPTNLQHPSHLIFPYLC